MGCTYKNTFKHLATERILHGSVVKKKRSDVSDWWTIMKNVYKLFLLKGTVLARPGMYLLFPQKKFTSTDISVE